MIEWHGNRCSAKVEVGGIIYPWTVRVGEVKYRHDARWEWTIRPSNMNDYIVTKTVKQGVCATKARAMAMVEANYCKPEGEQNVYWSRDERGQSEGSTGGNRETSS